MPPCRLPKRVTAPTPAPSVTSTPTPYPTAPPTSASRQWSCQPFAANGTMSNSVNFQTCGLQVCSSDFTTLTLSLCSARGGEHKGIVMFGLFDAAGVSILPSQSALCDGSPVYAPLELTYTLSGAPSPGLCAQYVLHLGCRLNAACSGRVVAFGTNNATQLVAFAPTGAPSVPPSPQPSRMPSVAPSPVPSMAPSPQPSAAPTSLPSASPTVRNGDPSAPPTMQPTTPTAAPSFAPTSASRQWSCQPFSANGTMSNSVNFQTCGLQVCGSATTLTLSFCEPAGGTHIGPVMLGLVDAAGSALVPRQSAPCDGNPVGSPLEFTFRLTGLASPSPGLCAQYVLHLGCRLNAACSGRVVAFGTNNATSPIFFPPTLAPILAAAQARPSAAPTPAVDGVAAASSGQKAQEAAYKISTGIALVLVFCASVALAYYIFYSRQKIEEEALELSEEVEEHKRKLDSGLFSFGPWDIMLAVPVSCMTIASACVQVAGLMERGATVPAAIVIASRASSTLLSIYCLYKSLYERQLSAHLLGVLLHQSSLWTAVMAVCVLDSSQLRLLPWRYSQFVKRSGGYPTLTMFHLTLISQALAALVSVIGACLSLSQ